MPAVAGSLEKDVEGRSPKAGHLSWRCHTTGRVLSLRCVGRDIVEMNIQLAVRDSGKNTNTAAAMAGAAISHLASQHSLIIVFCLASN